MKSVVIKLRKRSLAVIMAAVLTVGLTTAGICVKRVWARPLATVVIDAGHGGGDGGVVGLETGVTESDLNLKIALALKQQFESRQVKVILTRKDGDALADGADFKRQDFEARREIIRKSGADAVISIHQNSFPAQRSRRGSQVFYNAGDQSSRLLAEYMQRTLNENVNKIHSGRGYDALAGDYYIINCSEIPSVIVECGFLSNAQDERLLQSEKYISELAFQICSGALGYMIDKQVINFSDKVSYGEQSIGV